MILLFVALAVAVLLPLTAVLLHLVSRGSGAVGYSAVSGNARPTGEPERRRTIRILDPDDWGFRGWHG
jgi:hypothetical protein